MNQTLMVGLTERDMQAVVNTYNLRAFYYPTLFPLKETYSLTWKTLEATVGLRIAGDLVARGASLDKKTREAISRLQGDIPKIAVKRTKDENELNEYDIMVAMTSANPNLRALVEAWAEDTNFCWQAVANRIEWMALKQISLGKLSITADNNNGPLSEFDADYSIPAAHKKGYQAGSSSWATSNSAKPISVDFKYIVKTAKAEGINLKYAFMNLDTFAEFAETAEVIKLCSSWAVNLAGVAYTPSVEQANKALAGIPYLNGLQIRVIDQEITIEKKDGTRVTANPFENDVVMFSESEVLGNTFWKAPADSKLQGSKALKAQNGHTLIKKYSNEEPLEEVTVGLANAFPAWATSQRSYLFDCTHSSWSH